MPTSNGTALGFDFVFLQIESRAWRVPSQLRIRKSDRMPPGHCPAPQPRAMIPPVLRKPRVQSLPRRRQGDLTPREGGVQRGNPPLARGLGDVPPVNQQSSEGGRVGPTNDAIPTQVLPLPCQGVGAEPAPAKAGGLPCPCFVRLCRIRAIFRRGPRPTYGPRPATYDLSPFSGHFKPSRMAPRPLIRPVPGSYDLSPFVHLSVAPQTKSAAASSRHRPPGKNAPHNSIQIKPGLTGGGPHHGLP